MDVFTGAEPCPKCGLAQGVSPNGNQQISRAYIAATPEVPEHLNLQCTACAYSWDMLPKDAVA